MLKKTIKLPQVNFYLLNLNSKCHRKYISKLTKTAYISIYYILVNLITQEEANANFKFNFYKKYGTIDFGCSELELSGTERKMSNVLSKFAESFNIAALFPHL